MLLSFPHVSDGAGCSEQAQHVGAAPSVCAWRSLTWQGRRRRFLQEQEHWPEPGAGSEWDERAWGKALDRGKIR